MIGLPAELKDFPTDLLDKLKAGTLSSAQERKQLKEMGSGWLYTIASLATDARDEYKAIAIDSERAWAKVYKEQRLHQGSVSGAEKAADTSEAYLNALDTERIAETKWRRFDSAYNSILEAVQSLKNSTKYDIAEWKATGGEDGQ